MTIQKACERHQLIGEQPGGLLRWDNGGGGTRDDGKEGGRGGRAAMGLGGNPGCCEHSCCQREDDIG